MLIIFLNVRIVFYKLILYYRKYFHAHRKNLHGQNCAQCRFVNLQICDFCIWKNICAADLRILCTDGFCTFCRIVNLCTTQFSCFADLRIYVFMFCRFVKLLCECLCMCKIIFLHVRTNFHVFCKFCQNDEKVEISENVRFCPVGF